MTCRCGSHKRHTGLANITPHFISNNRHRHLWLLRFSRRQTSLALPHHHLHKNPVIYADIAPAVDYVRQLNDSRIGNFPGHPATAHEVGIAECYKAALVFAAAAPGQNPPAPPWVQVLQANMNQQSANMNQQFANVNLQLANIANDIVAMRNEQPILLANSQAGNREPLYNPTVPGWVLLAHPHPSTRDELFVFTQAQCIASAGALGPPPLPQNTPVAMRRRQIAIKLGVTI